MTIRVASARAALCVVMIVSAGMPAPQVILAQISDPPERAQDPPPEIAAPSRQSRNQEAIAKARDTLAQRERAQGPGHPAVADSLMTLAALLRDRGDYAEARTLYERALAIREKALGPNHRAVGATLNALGYLLFRMGDSAAARPMLERSVAIREKALGPSHAAVAHSLNALGLLLETTGQRPAARQVLDRKLGGQ